MTQARSAIAFTILAASAAFLAVPRLVDGHAVSVASQVLGTDDAFATSGLHLRENQIGGTSFRWTKRKTSFEFAGAGPGPIDLELTARGHRSDVTVVANGAILGVLPVGQSHFSSRVALGVPDVTVETITDGFLDHERTLGTQFDELRVSPAPGASSLWRRVPPRMWLALCALLVLSLALHVWARLFLPLCLLPPALLLAIVLPGGLWRSGWLFEATGGLAVAVIVAAFVGGRSVGSWAGRSALAVALFLAIAVHGVLPPSPVVAQADVQMHGHKLGKTAKGDFFPTSRTDHRPPFEIPYGFSFYGTLRPFASDDVANVAVVRRGAAFFSALSAVALGVFLGGTSAPLAAAALILWTFAPVNIRTMGFGNLSNVFAQAVFVLFLVAAGAMTPSRRRTLVLVLLAAVSATAHLSAFIVVLSLVPVAFLLRSDRVSSAFRPLVGGVVLAGAYYALFLPMVAAQLPRLLAERGGSGGVFDPWRLPAQIVLGLGWPFLALLGLAVLTASFRPVLPLARSLALTGLLLAIAALVSPVEVRYLLAVVPVLAVAAAAVFDDGDFRSFPRQSLAAIVAIPALRALSRPFVRVSVGSLILVAAVLRGTSVLLEFVPLAGVW